MLFNFSGVTSCTAARRSLGPIAIRVFLSREIRRTERWRGPCRKTQTGPPYFLAAAPPLAPPRPALFLWRPLRAPRGPFLGCCFFFLFPLKSAAPPSRLRRPCVSNKRCRSPACCCGGVGGRSHGRPSPGQLAALCIHGGLIEDGPDIRPHLKHVGISSLLRVLFND